FQGILFLLLIASSSPIYWSSVFAKDVVTTSLCIIATYCLVRKKYFVTLALIIVASLLRSYSIVLFTCFYLFMKNTRFLIVGVFLIGAAGITFIFTNFSLISIANLPVNL